MSVSISTYFVVEGDGIRHERECFTGNLTGADRESWRSVMDDEVRRICKELAADAKPVQIEKGDELLVTGDLQLAQVDIVAHAGGTKRIVARVDATAPIADGTRVKVMEAYEAIVIGHGMIPFDVPCADHRGQPGYQVRFYALDEQTGQHTDELEGPCWVLKTKVVPVS